MADQSLRYRIAHSRHPAVRFAVSARRSLLRFALPAPRVVFVPLLGLLVLLRAFWHTMRRVLFAEPFFKAYLTEYGDRFHTGIYLHWVIGKGRIVVGDDVTIDGKCSFIFAARYSSTPTLRIGSRSGMGHNCTFTVGKCIEIGDDCRLSGNITMFDASGHALEAEPRRRGMPSPEHSVKPILIANNVWIGNGVTIFPGVTIGENSVISSGAVVTSPVPANSLMVGNPARRIAEVPIDAPAREALLGVDAAPSR